MPWKSRAQAAYMHIHHPEIAKEWDKHTPKGKKLPEHVKKSALQGASDALATFGLKSAGEELRLKLPERKYHGYDAALKAEADRGHKKADCAPGEYGDRRSSEHLEDILQQLELPPGVADQKASKDPLDRATSWGPPTNPAAGDTAGRMSDMGVPQAVGTAF